MRLVNGCGIIFKRIFTFEVLYGIYIQLPSRDRGAGRGAGRPADSGDGGRLYRRSRGGKDRFHTGTGPGIGRSRPGHQPHLYLFDIGWEDYLARGGVCAVEWSEIVSDALEDGVLRVDIRRGVGDGQRIITITGGTDA